MFVAEAASAAAPERVAPVVDMEPAIAPDGSLAFVSNRSGAPELYVLSPDGTGLRQVTHEGGAKDAPAWSPDGRRLAFVAEASGDSNIFIINRDGKKLRRLTSGPENDLHPNWSPDGKTIVFTRHTQAKEGTADRLDIHSIGADGSNEQGLSSGPSASYASLSPDGRSLLYWRFFGENADIVVANADMTGERRLTDAAAFDGWPSWSPDGRSIAFARESGEDADIFILDTGTGALRQATSGPGRKISPKWSPDGRQIYFHGTVEGVSGLWRIAIEANSPS